MCTKLWRGMRPTLGGSAPSLVISIYQLSFYPHEMHELRALYTCGPKRLEPYPTKTLVGYTLTFGWVGTKHRGVGPQLRGGPRKWGVGAWGGGEVGMWGRLGNGGFVGRGRSMGIHGDMVGKVVGIFVRISKNMS